MLDVIDTKKLIGYSNNIFKTQNKSTMCALKIQFRMSFLDTNCSDIIIVVVVIKTTSSYIHD